MPNLSRWNPFRSTSPTRDEFARLMSTSLPFTSVFPFEEELSSAWAPAVDIYEDAEGITVKAEVSGVAPKDVDVKIENGVLTVKGERKLEKEDKKENYMRMERFYGSFMRSFTIPPQVDVEKIRAETKDGLLQIFLPKKAEAKPKQITVKVN
jgi:HSP20 family protein